MTRPRTSSTLKPAPPPVPTLSTLENTLTLTPLPELGPDIFTNTRPQWQPFGARGIYGGAVIAQSLLAATHTVEPQFYPHSMHCYFVLAGNPHLPLIYHVDNIRAGRSFQTRTVRALQQGKCIFTCTISFTLHVEEVRGEDGEVEKRVVSHQPVMPAGKIAGPEECEDEPAIIARLLAAGRIDKEQAEAAQRRWEKDPWDWRRIASDYPESTPPGEKVFRSWVRCKDAVQEKGMQLAALAYLSDSWLLGTVGRANQKARVSDIGMMVSLDHTIHFHTENVKMGEWLLVETQSPWAGGERGLARQTIYASDGRALASCEQEGMIRLKDGRQGGGTAESKL